MQKMMELNVNLMSWLSFPFFCERSDIDEGGVFGWLNSTQWTFKTQPLKCF